MRDSIIKNGLVSSSEKKLANVVLVLDSLVLVLLPLWFLMQYYNPFNALITFLALCIVTIINIVIFMIFIDIAYKDLYDIRHIFALLTPLLIVLSSDLLVFATVAGFIIALPINALFFILYLIVLVIYFSKNRNNIWLSKRLFIFYVVPALVWAQFLIVLLIRASLLKNL